MICTTIGKKRWTKRIFLTINFTGPNLILQTYIFLNYVIYLYYFCDIRISVFIAFNKNIDKNIHFFLKIAYL